MAFNISFTEAWTFANYLIMVVTYMKLVIQDKRRLPGRDCGAALAAVVYYDKRKPASLPEQESGRTCAQRSSSP